MDRDRHHKAVVVIGVLADEIDSPWCAEDARPSPKQFLESPFQIDQSRCPFRDPSQRRITEKPIRIVPQMRLMLIPSDRSYTDLSLKSPKPVSSSPRIANIIPIGSRISSPIVAFSKR